MAFELAERYEVDPWAALLLAVRLSAYHAQQVDMILATLRAPESNSDEALVRAWQHESRMERMLLAKTAKSAIDAGVAERLVREVELEGQLVALAVVAALDSLEITQDDRTRALEAAHRKLAEGVDDAPSSRGL